MTGIVLTSAMRANLLSLQNTQSLLDQTQLRLATGLKVNSALDSPTAFFAASALNNRAGDLSTLLDGMAQGINVLKAAGEGIEALEGLVQQAKAIAQTAADQAQGTVAPTDEVALEAEYDEIMNQIDQLITDTGYRGTNLLNGSTLIIDFSEDANNTLATLTITGVTYDSAGLGLTNGVDFADDTTISAELTAIETALTTLRSQARTFGNNLAIVEARQEFTENLINLLQDGAQQLTVADKNEEGANLLALQTTQQLGITSLSLASQANQSVLRLFS